jgi:hypothetical protein
MGDEDEISACTNVIDVCFRRGGPTWRDTEQCDKRYGEPIKARDFVIEDSETKSSRVYSSGDFNITIEWLQGFDKATSIEYEIKPNSNITFSNDLVFDLLKKNSDGKSWGAGTARRDFFN